ncbi:MAG TPA: helix-turn-helix transcriptional regulator [Umezawaea sp.]|nr:helix-turn-helix transcriptional regulator [Umezawaea sp.]
MVARRDVERRTLGELDEVLRSGPPAEDLFRESGRVLTAALGFDAVCWHLNDPITGLVSTVQSDELDLRGFALAIELATTFDDVTTFDKIRGSGELADTISRATGGRPQVSVRYREQLRPLGYGDELRANFDAQGGLWGCAAFMRDEGRGHFRPEELRLARVVARRIGVALRDLHVPDERPGAEFATLPAVAVLGADNALVSVDEGAETVIADLTAGATVRGAPAPFLVVAHRARQGLPAKTRVRTSAGTWLVAHASLLERRADGPVAVVVTEATPAELVPVVLVSYGLTTREQEVALHAVRGHTTAQIARLLGMAQVTVQDHLKSIFDKTGTRSRRELVAHLIMANFAENR